MHDGVRSDAYLAGQNANTFRQKQRKFSEQKTITKIRTKNKQNRKAFIRFVCAFVPWFEKKVRSHRREIFLVGKSSKSELSTQFFSGLKHV